MIRKKNKKIKLDEFDYNNNEPITRITMPDKRDVRQSDVYVNELNYVINKTSAKNICVSGPYGSGKSTVINKLELDYEADEFINISVGNMLNLSINSEPIMNSSGDGKIDSNEILTADRIEQSILRQLIHRDSSTKFLFSNIKRIPAPKIIFCYSVSILLLINYLCNNPFDKIVSPIVSPIIGNASKILFILFLFYVVSITVYRLVSVFACRLNELSIKKNSTELGINLRSSMPFLVNIFELILFFAKNKNIKFVVFEDIDRSVDDVSKIVIEELKELNKIINEAYGVNRKVTFIYSLRDDIFDDYDVKNKFYDYIISVMPFSTIGTSYFHLLELLKTKYSHNYHNKYYDNLIRIISQNVTDYRTMINISNDYKVFLHNINQYDVRDAIMVLTVSAIKNLRYDIYMSLINGKWEFDNIIIDLNNDEQRELLKLEKEISERKLLTSVVDDDKLSFDSILSGIKEIKKDSTYLVNTPYGTREVRISNINSNDLDMIIGLEDGDLLSLLKKYREELYSFTFQSKYKKTEKELESCVVFEGKEYHVDIRKNILLRMVDEKKYKNLDKIFFTKDKVNKDKDKVNKDKDKVNKDNLIIDLFSNGYVTNDILDYLSLPVSNSSFDINDYKYIKRLELKANAYDIPLVNISHIIDLLDNRIDEYDNICNYSLLRFLLLLDIYTLEEKHVLNKMVVYLSSLNNMSINFIYNFKEDYNYDNLIRKIFDNDVIYKTFDEMTSVKCELLRNDEKFTTILNDILKIVDFSKISYNFSGLVRYINNYQDLRKIALRDNTVLKSLLDLNISFNNISSKLSIVSRLILIKNNLYALNYENYKNLNLNFRNIHVKEYILSNLDLFYNKIYRDHDDVKINNKTFVKSIREKLTSENKYADIMNEFDSLLQSRELSENAEEIKD